MTIDPRHDDINYSLRRYYVDRFLAARVDALPLGARVLDLGGQKKARRGQFDIDAFGLEVVTANLVATKGADILADAGALPLGDGAFDAIICAEVLEHVNDPRPVLAETRRVLRPGGRLIATVPFLVRAHPDPADYARYTADFWRELLTPEWSDVEIEQQGRLRSVLVDDLRAWAARKERCGISEAVVRRLLAWGRRRALARDASPGSAGDEVLSSYATGFGIVARRPEETAP